MWDKIRRELGAPEAKIWVEVISKSLWKDDVRDLFQQAFERIWSVDYGALKVKDNKAS